MSEAVGHERNLTSGSLLARNVGMNFIGWGLPAIAALIALPLLVDGLGTARFGVLALAWTAIGYFSLFDLGIGRALTHAASASIGRQREDEVGGITWTALLVVLPIGAMGAALVFLGAPLLATRILEVPVQLQGEATAAFRLLAAAIPFTGAAAALRGVLEAKQRFGTVNALRIPYGLLTFLGPLAALPFSSSLVPAIAVLVGGRVALFLAHLIACLRIVPSMRRATPDRAAVKRLVTFGGWMTLTNVVSPLMSTLDRFVVGAAISVSVVTYYATPHELVTKMWLFTAALLPVFFPAFTTSASANPARAALLLDRVLRTTFAALFLPTLALVLLSRELLTVWMGPAFADSSARVMQILAIAVFANTMGQCGFVFVQALGRPDLTGKLHLAELPLYALLLGLLLPRFGVIGVAFAWAIRTMFDTVALLLMCPKLLPDARKPVTRIFAWLGIALSVLAASAIVPYSPLRIGLFVGIAIGWTWLAWWRILTPVERTAPLRALTYKSAETSA